MTRRALLAGLAALGAQPCSGAVTRPLSEDILPRVREVVDAIFRLDYPAAHILSRQLKQDMPEHPVGYVYQLRVYWSEELSRLRQLSVERMIGMDLFGETPRFRPIIPRPVNEQFERAALQTLTLTKAWAAKNRGDVSAQFLLGTAYHYISGYQLTVQGSRYKALSNASHSFHILQEIIRMHPGLADARVVTGAFMIIADSLGPHTKWILWLLGISGNLQLGRQQLEIAAESGTLADDDARYALGIFYTRSRQFDSALARLNELREKYPENHLIPFDIAAVQLLMKEPLKAMQTYSQMLTRSFAGVDRSVIQNYMGVTARMSGSLKDSERWLRESVGSTTVSPNARSVARLELGKTLDLQGQRDAAIQEYRSVLATPDLLGLHEDAARLVRKPYHHFAGHVENGASGAVTLSQ